MPDGTTNTGNTGDDIIDQVGQGPNGQVNPDGGPAEPTDYVEAMDYDTSVTDIGGVPDFGGGVDADAAESGLLGNTTSDPNATHSTVDENGNVTIAGQAETRQVQDEELTSHQMSKLLSSDSKYMQDARRQGMEQSAAMGGLGGTVGIGASMQAAIRAGLPIAQADAQAFQQAASENMQALNQYAQLNLQRATQLQTAHLDAKTQIRNNAINTNANIAISKLDSATKRDISRLDAETQLRSTEMQGQIQAQLASFQHQYNSLLEDQKAYNDLLKTQMQGEYNLADRELAGRWESQLKEQEQRLNRESTANNLLAATYDGYMNRLADLNGQDMDQNARNAAVTSITNGAKAMFAMVKGLYPDLNLPDFA